MQKAFDFLDTDKSGFVERGELQQAFKGIVALVLKAMAIDEADLPAEAREQMAQQIDEKTTELMNVIDDNGDGKISFEEFKKGASKLASMAT